MSEPIKTPRSPTKLPSHVHTINPIREQFSTVTLVQLIGHVEVTSKNLFFDWAMSLTVTYMTEVCTLIYGGTFFFPVKMPNMRTWHGIFITEITTSKVGPLLFY